MLNTAFNPAINRNALYLYSILEYSLKHVITAREKEYAIIMYTVMAFNPKRLPILLPNGMQITNHIAKLTTSKNIVVEIYE